MRTTTRLQSSARHSTGKAGSIVLAALSVLVLGSFVCGCDTGYKFSTPNEGRGPGSIAPGAGDTTTTPVSTVTSAPLCNAADLTAKGGRRQDPNDAGGAIGDVIITNSASSACELKGNPAVDLLTNSGHSLVVAVGDPITNSLPPVVLQARQHSAGELVFTWQNWCSPSPGALEMRIALANGRGDLFAPLDGKLGTYVPTCFRPGSPSTLRIQYAYVNAGTSKLSNA
jgi:Protein of unknown function (DUF4232)